MYAGENMDLKGGGVMIGMLHIYPWSNLKDLDDQFIMCQDPLQSRLREAESYPEEEDGEEGGYSRGRGGQSPAGSSSPRGQSPGGASPPRLAMPTPLLGGRLPFPPHLQVW